MPAKPATIIISRRPYAADDLCRNALRLAAALAATQTPVNVFLLGEGVYLALLDLKAPEESAYNLAQMLAELYEKSVRFRVCETCVQERGVALDELDPRIERASMVDLANWMNESCYVVRF